MGLSVQHAPVDAEAATQLKGGVPGSVLRWEGRWGVTYVCMNNCICGTLCEVHRHSHNLHTQHPVVPTHIYTLTHTRTHNTCHTHTHDTCHIRTHTHVHTQHLPHTTHTHTHTHTVGEDAVDGRMGELEVRRKDHSRTISDVSFISTGSGSQGVGESPLSYKVKVFSHSLLFQLLQHPTDPMPVSVC